jgi:hypothetical protein
MQTTDDDAASPAAGSTAGGPPPSQPPPPQTWDRVEAALFPHLCEKRQRVQEQAKLGHGRFVHYTSAEGVEGILKNRCVWMRSTTCMNDFSEVRHGYNLLLKAWPGDSGKAFQAALNNCHPDVAREVALEFDKQTAAIMNGSFVACFSEHDPNEDEHGRLSMWRAYCNPAGVALVLNSAPFFLRSDALKAYSSPVAYLDDRKFAEIIHHIAANVTKERDLLASLDRQFLRDVVLNVLRFAILCTKHPAFEEEREWRVVYTPELFNSTRLKRAVRVIRGVAQPVYDLPLENIPEQGLVGIEIPEFVHKIIIGPTQYPSALGSALWFLLQDARVNKPHERIILSGVPLRT